MVSKIEPPALGVKWWKVDKFLKDRAAQLNEKLEQWERENPEWEVTCYYISHREAFPRPPRIICTFELLASARPDRDIVEGGLKGNLVCISPEEIRALATFLGNLGSLVEGLKFSRLDNEPQVVAVEYEITVDDYTPFKK